MEKFNNSEVRHLSVIKDQYTETNDNYFLSDWEEISENRQIIRVETRVVYCAKDDRMKVVCTPWAKDSITRKIEKLESIWCRNLPDADDVVFYNNKSFKDALIRIGFFLKEDGTLNTGYKVLGLIDRDGNEFFLGGEKDVYTGTEQPAEK